MSIMGPGVGKGGKCDMYLPSMYMPIIQDSVILYHPSWHDLQLYWARGTSGFFQQINCFHAFSSHS